MSRRDMIRMLVVSGSMAGAVLVGCGAETRQKVLPIFFDGIPRAGEQKQPPPTRRVRRDLLREIEDLRRELAVAQAAAKASREGRPAEEAQRPAEQAKTWQEVAAALPKDAADNVDWVQALRAGAIQPRPGVDPKASVQAALELDVDLATSSSKLFSVTFSHAAHTQWLSCGNCHPRIFPLKRGEKPVVATMAKIQSGQLCGACHGRVAFGIERECGRCHTQIPTGADWRPPKESRKPIEHAGTWDEAAKLLPITGGAPDWSKALGDGVIAPRPGLDPNAGDEPELPLDVERSPAGGDMFKVIFPHQPHTALLKCDSCHPAIFQMARGTTPMNMGLIYAGQTCGVCHGKVAFPATACGRCHPAMASK